MAIAGPELVKQAEALTGLLREQAPHAERARQPSDAVIEAIRESGIFDMMVPAAYGGLELDLDCFLDVGLALAEADASAAWVTCFYIEHNWMLCQFPAAFQQRLFSDRNHILAPATIAPTGRADRTEKGFVVSGRWKWGTGIVHGEWVLVGVIAQTREGNPDLRLFALPRASVQVEDTWHVDGMAGTGSHDIVVDGVEVPLEQTVDLMQMTSGQAPGATLHAGPLYRTPMIPILAQAASMPALGQARAGVRAFREHLADRVLYGSGVRQADRPAAQMRLARADLEVRQAELLMRDVVSEVMALRDKATITDRARWTSAYALIVDTSKRVLASIAEASGASAHFLSHPLQRSVRDVNVMACHVVFDLDERLALHGRGLLGQEIQGLV